MALIVRSFKDRKRNQPKPQQKRKPSRKPVVKNREIKFDVTKALDEAMAKYLESLNVPADTVIKEDIFFQWCEIYNIARAKDFSHSIDKEGTHHMRFSYDVKGETKVAIKTFTNPYALHVFLLRRFNMIKQSYKKNKVHAKFVNKMLPIYLESYFKLKG